MESAANSHAMFSQMCCSALWVEGSEATSILPGWCLPFLQAEALMGLGHLIRGGVGWPRAWDPWIVQEFLLGLLCFVSYPYCCRKACQRM